MEFSALSHYTYVIEWARAIDLFCFSFSFIVLACVLYSVGWVFYSNIQIVCILLVYIPFKSINKIYLDFVRSVWSGVLCNYVTVSVLALYSILCL